MSDKRFMEARFLLDKGEGGNWSEQEIDGFIDAFIDSMPQGLFAGGSFGPLLSEEKECNYCEGSGEQGFINEKDRCETCGGSGRKDEEEPTSDPEATEEWNEIYAPVAQGTEQPSPKGQVEGSNPSRSAKDEDRAKELVQDDRKKHED